MIIGVMTANLHLQGIGSLKEKRSIVKSVIGRLQSRFNVSISEVDHNDSKIIATLGVAVVGNDKSFIESQLETVANFYAQRRQVLSRNNRTRNFRRLIH